VDYLSLVVRCVNHYDSDIPTLCPASTDHCLSVCLLLCLSVSVCLCSAVDYLSMVVRCVNHDDSDIAALCPANAVQREAIRRAVIKSFSLIQTPPGSGKTLTALRLAALFVRINRSLSSAADYERHYARPQLMICGPTDESVDIIASKSYRHYWYRWNWVEIFDP